MRRKEESVGLVDFGGGGWGMGGIQNKSNCNQWKVIRRNGDQILRNQTCKFS